jgi:hypothetical protein
MIVIPRQRKEGKILNWLFSTIDIFGYPVCWNALISIACWISIPVAATIIVVNNEKKG